MDTNTSNNSNIRHRGDHYSSSVADYDHSPRRPRRPSRFSDGPPPFRSRFSDVPPPPHHQSSRFSSDGPPHLNRYSNNAHSDGCGNNNNNNNNNNGYNRRTTNPVTVNYHGPGAGGRSPFETPPCRSTGGGGGFGPMGGGGEYDGMFHHLGSGGGGFGGPPPLNFPTPPLHHQQHPQPTLPGQKRGFPYSTPGSYPDQFGGGGHGSGFAKLFV